MVASACVWWHIRIEFFRLLRPQLRDAAGTAHLSYSACVCGEGQPPAHKGSSAVRAPDPLLKLGTRQDDFQPSDLLTATPLAHTQDETPAI